MIYGAEAWTLRRSEEGLLERTEMRMLRWMLGITLRDRKRNDDIHHANGVCCIIDKIRESRLRWYGHVQRREDDHCVKRILKAEAYGRRNRGKAEEEMDKHHLRRPHQPEPHTSGRRGSRRLEKKNPCG